ncbi:FHA domain-containing protein [Actinoplanes sp. M2I2]|uniref:FHA domain-containing protein n=1 Tax=Actinoplanes sp. M2I2 TaxID=1734444 RepID=UPI0020228360|nr:FHA domain-containing protein [Actinoplanes sp. M2I2]
MTMPAPGASSAPVTGPRSSAPQPGPASPARLVRAPGGGSFALPARRAVVIGTAPDADLRLTDSYANRRHARVSPSDGAFWVEDLGTTNGTTRNGHRVDGRERLRPGDVIGVGRTRLEFTRTDAPVPVDAAQPPGRGGAARALSAAGAGLACAGLGWWLVSAYAAALVGSAALVSGVLLIAGGWIRAGRRLPSSG